MKQWEVGDVFVGYLSEAFVIVKIVDNEYMLKYLTGVMHNFESRSRFHLKDYDHSKDGKLIYKINNCYVGNIRMPLIKLMFDIKE